MIRTIHFAPSDQSPLAWAREKIPENLEFSDDISILVGPNGSGKSALLGTLAAATLCQRTGRPLLDFSTLTAVFPQSKNRAAFLLDGIRVEHDGQVIYAHGHRDASLADDGTGMADFGKALLARRHSVISSGEVVLDRLSGIIQLLAQEANPEQFFDLEETLALRLKRYKKPTEEKKKKILEEILTEHESRGQHPLASFPAFENLLEGKSLLSPWDEYYTRLLDTYLSGKSLSPKKPTILLDEPDTTLSLPLQAKLWHLLTHKNVRQRYQIIVATHSVFPFLLLRRGVLDRTNFVEMVPGYVETIQAILRQEIEG